MCACKLVNKDSSFVLIFHIFVATIGLLHCFPFPGSLFHAVALIAASRLIPLRLRLLWFASNILPNAIYSIWVVLVFSMWFIRHQCKLVQLVSNPHFSLLVPDLNLPANGLDRFFLLGYDHKPPVSMDDLLTKNSERDNIVIKVLTSGVYDVANFDRYVFFTHSIPTTMPHFNMLQVSRLQNFLLASLFCAHIYLLASLYFTPWPPVCWCSVWVDFAEPLPIRLTAREVFDNFAHPT